MYIIIVFFDLGVTSLQYDIAANINLSIILYKTPLAFENQSWLHLCRLCVVNTWILFYMVWLGLIHCVYNTR